MTALLRTPRILYAALGSYRHLSRIEAVKRSWARALLPTDRLVWLGDEKLRALLPEDTVWPVVRADGPDDGYGMLPVKMRKGLHRALRDPDWDFLVKVDDDTHVIPARLAAILSEYSPEVPLFASGEATPMNSARYYDHAQRGREPFDFTFLQGGTGYCLSRPALEKAMPLIDTELTDSGMEDVMLSMVMDLAGVKGHWLGPFSSAEREWESLIYGAAYAIHRMTERDHRFAMVLQEELPVLPFIVASANLGWGEVGLHGSLGFDGSMTRVRGNERRDAIAAHAPSALLLRATPGCLLGLRGALNDTASDETHGSFRVLDSQRRLLANLGMATRERPTYRETVMVPPDGRLRLEITTDHPELCHTLWLWDLDPYSIPPAYPFTRHCAPD